MPFTPFHIGHAVITYSILDKLDFIALLYGSILVDVEPFLILFLNLPYPLHNSFNNWNTSHNTTNLHNNLDN